MNQNSNESGNINAFPAGCLSRDQSRNGVVVRGGARYARASDASCRVVSATDCPGPRAVEEIGVVVLVAELAQVVLPMMYIRTGVAVTLVGLGVYKLIPQPPLPVGWHASFQVSRDLTIWSFLMAFAHGAGLMVLPVVLAGPHAHHHMASMPNASNGVWATLIHTLGYFALTATAALLVYRKFGLAMLSHSWFNLDRVWAIALVVTGLLAFLV